LNTSGRSKTNPDRVRRLIPARGMRQAMQAIDKQTIARIMTRRACNWTYEEISDDIGVSKNTVKKYCQNFEEDSKEFTPEMIVGQVLRHVLKVSFDE